MKLCSVQQVKTLTQQSSTYAGHDDLIAQMIDIASAQVLQYSKRDFARRVRSEYFMTPEGRGLTVTVKEGPILEDGTLVVTYDPDGIHDISTPLIANYDYTVDYERGVLTIFGFMAYSPRGIKVQYTGGYAADVSDPSILQVPANVSLATALQATFLLNRHLAGSQGVSSEMKDGTTQKSYSKQAQSGLIPEATSMLGTTSRVMVGRY
jgi:hypothetical protein